MADTRVGDAVFFGCWGQAGHYFFYPDKSHPREEKLRDAGFPVDRLDGSRIFLPSPETKGHGRLTYLPAPGIHVLSWWNSVWDERGGVNSHFMYRHPGVTLEMWNMWHSFKHHFPDIFAQHTKPIIGITY